VLSAVTVATIVGALAGVAAAADPQSKRAAAASFTVPVPRGYNQTDSPDDAMIKSSGGVVLEQSKAAGPGLRQGRIVVTPITKAGFDASKAATCQKMANDAAKAIEATVTEQGIVGAAFGPTCQWTSNDNKEKNRAATVTVVYSRKENWMVTCTYDLRDKSALKACKEVVAGWIFKL
jgi:hypothetical protein